MRATFSMNRPSRSRTELGPRAVTSSPDQALDPADRNPLLGKVVQPPSRGPRAADRPSPGSPPRSRRRGRSRRRSCRPRPAGRAGGRSARSPTRRALSTPGSTSSPAQTDGRDDAGAGGAGLAAQPRIDDGDAGTGARTPEAGADADDAAADHHDVEVVSARIGGAHRQRSPDRDGTSRRALLPTTWSRTSAGRSIPEIRHRPVPGGFESEYGKYSSSVLRNRRYVA